MISSTRMMPVCTHARFFTSMPTLFGLRMIFVTCGQPASPCLWSLPCHSNIDSSATTLKLATKPSLRFLLNAFTSGCTFQNAQRARSSAGGVVANVRLSPSSLNR